MVIISVKSTVAVGDDREENEAMRNISEVT